MRKPLLIWLLLWPIWGMAQAPQSPAAWQQLADSLAEAHAALAAAGDYEAATRSLLAHQHALSEWQKRADSLAFLRLTDSLQLRERQAEITLKSTQTANRYRLMGWLGGGIGLLVLLIWGIGRVQRQRHRQEKLLYALAAQTQAQELARQALEVQRAEWARAQLQERLTLKNQQLSGRLLQAIQHNRLLRVASGQIDPDTQTPEMRQAIQAHLEHLEPPEVAWQAFLAQFRATYPQFFPRLEAQVAPQTLGETEQKLLALLRLQLSAKEIASLLDLTPASVKTSRYRLAKKLAVPENQRLTDYLLQLG